MSFQSLNTLMVQRVFIKLLLLLFVYFQRNALFAASKASGGTENAL